MRRGGVRTYAPPPLIYASAPANMNKTDISDNNTPAQTLLGKHWCHPWAFGAGIGIYRVGLDAVLSVFTYE